MVCKECEKRGKNWEGDDPQCAFKGKEFGYNWNCATVGLIRDICDELGQERPQGVDYQYCEDQKYATVKVDHIESLEGRPLALWVSWYKRRGATDAMWLLFEHIPPRRPTEQECLCIAQAYGSNANYGESK